MCPSPRKSPSPDLISWQAERMKLDLHMETILQIPGFAEAGSEMRVGSCALVRSCRYAGGFL